MDGTPRTNDDLLAGRYRLGRVIARGGSGVVYAAEDTRVGSEVAVKLLRRALAADAVAVARMVREVELVARLKHPNVVRVIDVGAERDEPFLVMELLEGRTLAERVEAEGPLPIDRVRTIAAQLLDALDAVHAAGVLHRDLKPANVFLVPVRRGELVKLLDFGHGVLHDGSSAKLTESGFFAGTPGYIAPERLRGGGHDERSDVYGAAVCLYEALTGKPAFHAPSPLALHAAIIQGSWAPIASLRADAPAALVTAIERAMHVDPARRFASASELAQAIEDALAPGPNGSVDPYARTLRVASSVDAPRAPRRTEPAANGPRDRSTAMRLGLVLLAVSIAGAWWLTRASAATDASSGGAQEASQAPAEASQAPAEASQAPAEASQAPAEASRPSAEASQASVASQGSTEHRDVPSGPLPATTPAPATDREETTPRAPRARTIAPASSAPATSEVTAPEAPPAAEAPPPIEAAPTEAAPSRADEMFVPSWAR